jgi:hypothetical protein
MSLVQLTGTMHYTCKELEFELRSSHLSTLKVKFLGNRLLNQKKDIAVSYLSMSTKNKLN